MNINNKFNTAWMGIKQTLISETLHYFYLKIQTIHTDYSISDPALPSKTKTYTITVLLFGCHIFVTELSR